jgi:hypothetical protein
MSIPHQWFNIDETLTHNCLFNFIIGPRGVGKTYSSKDRAIRNFMKGKGQFIYVRRYKEELMESLDKNKFWKAMAIKYPQLTFTTEGTELKINGETAGYGVALSTSNILKSTEYPSIKFIIFDEFLIEQGTHRYLPKEVQKFLDLYETIARMREDVVAVFLANAISITNPYFMFFDISVPYGSNFYKRGDLLFQYVDNPTYIEAKKQTRFGKLIEHTNYGGYAIENKFLLDSGALLEKKGGKAQFIFALGYDGNRFGVWVDYSLGKFWVSYDIPARVTMDFVLTQADHSENTILIKTLSNNRIFKVFIESYRVGKVFFEDMNIKNTIYQCIKAFTV